MFRWASITLIGVLFFCVDRLSKFYFVYHQSDQWPVLGHWVGLQYHLNLEMALSLPLFPFIYYTSVSIIIGVLILQIIKSIEHKKLFDYAIILLILVGAISNVIDRLFYGGVVDFIVIWLGSVFNLADVYIVSAVLVWLLRLSTHVSKEN